MDVSRESDREVALRAALDARGFAYSRIVGTSMLPTLAPGDIVLVRPCRSLRPGDVVTFVLAGRLITHRLVRVTDEGLVCRGDNRLRPDPRVAADALIGRVAEVVGRPAPNRAAEFLHVRARWRWRGAAARLARAARSSRPRVWLRRRQTGALSRTSAELRLRARDGGFGSGACGEPC